MTERAAAPAAWTTRRAGDRPRVVVVGDAGLDVVARYADPLTPGGDTRAAVSVEPGGAGANTAAWLAALGADPLLVARVGDDPAGQQVADGLAAAGVECAFTVDRAAPTCCVVVLVDRHGQRTMLADRGANGRFSPADLPDLVAAARAGARHLHLSGYLLLDASSRPAAVAALAGAAAAGLTTSIDPQAARLITDPETFLTAVHGVDLLLPNQAELAALTGSADPASAVRLLDRVGAVAVTTASAGATWVDRDGVVTVPGEPAACVDSTGAGDAFDAGLLVAWLAGAGPAEAVRAGVAAGTRAVGVVGARPPATRPAAGSAAAGSAVAGSAASGPATP